MGSSTINIEIESLFEEHFDGIGLEHQPTPFDGRSDYGPFIEVGIASGGLFTGAEGIKTTLETGLYGGESGAAYDACYHEDCDDLYNNPIGRQNFTWGSPKSKNVDYKVEHPVFSSDENGKPKISYIDQFPEPKNMDQGNFLQRLSDALEESINKIITKLPVGSSIIANNYFWLHGRRSFRENEELRRELLRIRGYFFE